MLQSILKSRKKVVGKKTGGALFKDGVYVETFDIDDDRKEKTIEIPTTAEYTKIFKGSADKGKQKKNKV